MDLKKLAKNVHLRINASDFINLAAVPCGLNIESDGAVEQFDALLIATHHTPVRLGKNLQ